MAIDVNIPSQVKNYANLAAFPATGTLKTIFIAEDTNKTYRWTGSAYVEISATAASTWGAIGGTLSNQTDLQNALNTKEPTITAGTTSQYYRGDKSFQTLDKNAVGLSNVDNTSDVNKPVSTATQTALNAKQATLVSATNIKTINGTTLLGSGDLVVGGGVTIGTTAITSGTVGRVLFEGTGNVVQESANLFWDNTNGRLGVGTASPTQALNVSGFSVLTTSKTTATPILAVTNTTSSNPNSNNLDCFAPNMPNASVLGVFYGGKNINSRNNFGFNWNHVSDGSTGNSVSFEMVNVANIIRAWATGNVGLNTGTDAGFKLDVNGTARVQGVLSALTSSTNGIVLRNDLGTNSQIDWVAGVTRISLQRTSGDGLNILTSAGTFTMYTRSDGTLIGGSSLGDLQASAQLQVQSTTKGFLPPRMTTTQKNAIATPATGLVIFDSTLNKLCVRGASAWETITSV